MLGDIIKGILSFLWAIVRTIVLAAVMNLIQKVISVAIVYPIGATGQMMRMAVDDRQSSYNPSYLGRLRRQAAFGVLLVVVSWTGAYFLFGRGGVLIIGGITVLIAVLGWFNKLVVPDVDYDLDAN